jgi:AcrR family transcriptional regulator
MKPDADNLTRPGDDRSARTRILDTAEQLFAELGYDGTSVRQIAIKAEVPVALVSYHFEGKLGLYRAVFAARVPTIVEQRAAGLALADMEDDPRRRLEMRLRAILGPMLRLRTTEGRHRIGTLFAREVNDPQSGERGIVEDILDPVANASIELLREAMPGRSEGEIGWAYQMIVGTMFYIMADNGRMARMSGGACDPNDEDGTMRHVIQLLLYGLKGGPAD